MRAATPRSLRRSKESTSEARVSVRASRSFTRGPLDVFASGAPATNDSARAAVSSVDGTCSGPVDQGRLVDPAEGAMRLPVRRRASPPEVTCITLPPFLDAPLLRFGPAG